MHSPRAFRPVLLDSRLEARLVLSLGTISAQVYSLSTRSGPAPAATANAIKLTNDILHIAMVNYSHDASALVQNAQAQITAGLLTPTAATTQLLSSYTANVIPNLAYGVFQAALQLPYGAGNNASTSPGAPIASPYKPLPSGGPSLFTLLTTGQNGHPGPVAKMGANLTQALQVGDYAGANHAVSLRGIMPYFREAKSIVNQYVLYGKSHGDFA